MPSAEPKTSPMPKYVEAVLPVPLRRSFTYRIPESMQGTIKMGARMTLPFGRRDVTGYAVKLHTELPPGIEIDEAKIKDVLEVTDDEPMITPEILELTKWTADYYASFWGEMLKASLPAGINTERVRPKRRKAIRLINGGEREPDARPLTENQQRIVDLLTANGGEMKKKTV
jgi:primosomal protein N' (replication factor Y)